MASEPKAQLENGGRKVMLIAIDGWGVTDEKHGNAILAAKTPVMDGLKNNALYTEVCAHGEAVGLPAGNMGNSEVGHLTMGAGRVQFQDLDRINKAIKDGKFASNPILVNCFKYAVEKKKKVHFAGLVSDGGVHSHIKHLEEFFKAAKAAGVPASYVHFFADGRDTAPTSGVTFVQQLQEFLAAEKYGSIATLMGRYYAMDRDKRWERITIAYEGMVQGKGEECSAEKLIEVVKKRYEAKETDEFLKPIIVDKAGLVEEGDALIFIDFRSDRMRQICGAFGGYQSLKTDKYLKDVNCIQMTQYDASYPFPIIFKPQSMNDGLCETVSKAGHYQFHCAETEKYAHVTFFFNGGREQAFDKEERKLVASPKVATYDLQPSMSAIEVAEECAKALATEKYALAMCNFAPPDMVGHTGKFEPAVKAVETTDKAIGIIADACQKYNYTLLITADHGNAEVMLDKDNNEITKHTCNPVPFIIVPPNTAEMGKVEWKASLAGSKASKGGKAVSGKGDPGLADVAPTALAIMGIASPSAIEGNALVTVKQ
eukprot:g47501.t1